MFPEAITTNQKQSYYDEMEDYEEGIRYEGYVTDNIILPLEIAETLKILGLMRGMSMPEKTYSFLLHDLANGLIQKESYVKQEQFYFEMVRKEEKLYGKTYWEDINTIILGLHPELSVGRELVRLGCTPTTPL